MERHKAAVEAISNAVRKFHVNNQTFRISHGSTNSTRPSKHPRTVDTSALCHVLRVDPAKRIALVEPNVPMDRLVDVTMRYGLVPPVVMEFPGITVGGGYNGTSGESSSFKHGYFNETLNNIEMVLANGEIISASPTHNADLFYGASGACGTLGVTTLVELRLMQAKKYVETTYHPVGSVKEAVQTVQKLKEDHSLDYLDGIQFSKTCGAVVTGRLTDSTPSDSAVRTFTGAWDPWYYLHVKNLVSPSSDGNMPAATTEFIPIWDYLFRYDRGGFWVARSAFQYFSFVPFTRLTRWFLDDFLRTRMLYSALHASKQSDRYVVQDLALPYDQAEDFVDWCEKETGIWPLWLCPLAVPTTAPIYNTEGTIHPHTPHFPTGSGAMKPTLNIGLWGIPPANISTAFRSLRSTSSSSTSWVMLNRALESKLTALGGMKWLYAHTYYTSSEFWNVYDQSWYTALRRKFGAEGLPSIYDKVKRLPKSWDVNRNELGKSSDETSQVQRIKKSILDTWPFGGLYGVWKAILSGEWKKARKAHWVDIGPVEDSNMSDLKTK